MNTIHAGHATRDVSGFLEFAEGESPPLLTQSGRAGARLSCDERYLGVNRDFALLLQTTLPREFLSHTMAAVWEPGSYQRIQPALLECQSQGPQMVQGCRLQADPLQRYFDILFVSEPQTHSILQVLFEGRAAVPQDESADELRRLRAIVDLAPVLISIKDRHGVIRLTNRMFEVLDGPQPEEYLNRSVFDMFPRDVADHLWKNDLAVFLSGRVLEAEEVVRHRDGSEHTYLTYKYPLMQANGEIIEVCAISTDITARKYYEQEALEAQRKAEDANRVKSDFLAHMSHEIRTPLTVIRGYAEVIARKNGADAETIRHWIASVVRASKQLELIINDILDLSKVEAGMIEMEKTAVDLQPFLQDLQQSFTLRAQEKGLELRVEALDGVPPVVITDALRLRQVLDNLVSNALKFTDQGFVHVVVEAASSAGEARLHFWVRDSGIGLSEEEQTKLFQPFVQADNSITRKYGGTGLGLVLAKRLAQMLGGDASIHRSVPLRGTEMLVSIPVGHEDQIVRTQVALIKSSTELDSSQRLRGRRLLIVEDAEDIRAFLHYFLSQHGAHVETAASGQEALLCLDVHVFDVVLMDLQMPLLDGKETTRAMRARGFKGVIVALTAHALMGEREKCLKAGFDEFLSKPIQLPQVLDLIEHMLRLQTANSNPINSRHEP